MKKSLKIFSSAWEKLKSATSPSFTVNVISQTFQQIYSFLFRLAFSIVISRSLGPYGRGLISTLAEFLGFAGLASSLGMPASLQYHIASKKYTPKEAISNYIFFVLVYSYSLVFLLLLFSPFLLTHILKGLSYSIFVVSMIFFALGIYFAPLDVLLSAFQRFPQLSFIIFILFALRLGLLILFLIILKWGIWGALLSDWVLFPLGVYLRLYFLKDALQMGSFKPNFNKDVLRDLFNYSWKVFIADIFTKTTLRVDILLISYFQSPTAVGFYTIAVNYTEISLLVSSGLATVLFPRVSSLPKEQAQKLTLLLTRSFPFYIIPTALLLLSLATIIIPFFYGEKFLPSTEVVKYLLPGIIAWCYGMQMGNYLSGRGHPEFILYASASAAFVSLVGDFLFIPIMGIKGAAIVSSLSYGTYFLLIFYFFKQITSATAREIFLPTAADAKFLFNLLKTKVLALRK